MRHSWYDARYIFHPCYLLPHFPLLHFPLPHFQRASGVLPRTRNCSPAVTATGVTLTTNTSCYCRLHVYGRSLSTKLYYHTTQKWPISRKQEVGLEKIVNISSRFVKSEQCERWRAKRKLCLGPSTEGSSIGYHPRKILETTRKILQFSAFLAGKWFAMSPIMRF